MAGNVTIDAKTGMFYFNDNRVYFENFKKCIIHNGTWSPPVNTCSINVATFPNVASDDPNLESALNAIEPAVINELNAKLPAATAMTGGSKRGQISGRDLEDWHPKSSPSVVIIMVQGLMLMATLLVLAWAVTHKWGQHCEKTEHVQLEDGAVDSVYKDKVEKDGSGQVGEVYSGHDVSDNSYNAAKGEKN